MHRDQETSERHASHSLGGEQAGCRRAGNVKGLGVPRHRDRHERVTQPHLCPRQALCLVTEDPRMGLRQARTAGNALNEHLRKVKGAGPATGPQQCGAAAVDEGVSFLE